jgi:hypothetical protein
VDEAKVAKAVSVVTPAGENNLRMSGAIGSRTESLPPLRPSPRGTEEITMRRAEAEALLENQKTEALTRFISAYRAQLLAAARVTAATLESELAERADARAEQAIDATYSLVTQNVDERAKILARLALLTKWPELVQLNFFPIARSSAVRDKWESEAKQLREDLSALDRSVSDRIDAILSGNRALLDAESKELARRIQSEFDKAETEAIEKARQRLTSADRKIPSLLTTRQSILHPSAGGAITIPAVVFDEPPIPEPVALPPPSDAIQTRLNIWARIHGYKLGRGPNGAVDKTGEFIAWINHR